MENVGEGWGWGIWVSLNILAMVCPKNPWVQR